MKEYEIEISRSQRNLDMDLPGDLVFGIPGKDGVGISSIVYNDDYTITFVLSDGSRYTTPSTRGEAGRGIVSIERTDGNGAAGTYDTYTITYTDNTTFDFKVYNGANGTGGGSVEGAVLYTEQELTEEQKAQARENIGALGVPMKQVETTYRSTDLPLQGYIDLNGIYQETMSFNCTDFIKVSPGMTLEYFLTSYVTIFSIAYYDSEKNFVSGIKTDKESTDWEFSGISTVPDGVAYIRLTILNGSVTNYIKVSGTVSLNVADILNKLESNNPLFGKILTATGDSITATVSNRPYASYAKMIAENNDMVYQDKAIWGATLADGIEGSSGCILTTLNSMREDADYIILSGGANDFYYLSSGQESMGEISSGYSSALDANTFCGALETLCKTAIERWPGKKILFVITHRMLDISNSNLETWVNTMKEILEKWGISYVDLWHEMPSLFLPALKNLYTTMGNTEYNGTGDGLHPNEDGYRLYYVPRVEMRLKSI